MLRRLVRIVWFGIIAYCGIVALLLIGLICSSDPATIPSRPPLRHTTAVPSMTADLPPLPPLLQYTARDGETLSYCRYDGVGSVVVLLIHGSAGQSGVWHDMATQLVRDSAVRAVLVLNLRGHFCSGKRRGDCSYIGQLEDDCADLIEKAQIGNAPIVLVGHSAGGGFALRLAGGSYGKRIGSYVLLGPAIPTACTLKGGTAGGWAQMASLRIALLFALNGLGITAFNGLPVVHWNRDPAGWKGFETLSYTYRLLMSLMPRFMTSHDIDAIRDRVVVVGGDRDVLITPDQCTPLFPQDRCHTLVGVDHVGLLHAGPVRDLILEQVHTLDRATEPERE